MVICNFNISRTCLGPFETNSVLIINTDAMLTLPILG
jgi:hypothetical protein